MKKILRVKNEPSVGVASGVVVVFLLALLALAALSFPVRDGMVLNAELISVRAHLNELEALYPLSLELERVALDSRWSDLPATGRRALTQDEVLEIPAQFSQMAQACGMELVAVRPRVVSGPVGRRWLHVDVHTAGSYDGLRDWLMQVLALPSLEHIEQVAVERETLHERVEVSLWLALQ